MEILLGRTRIKRDHPAGNNIKGEMTADIAVITTNNDDVHASDHVSKKRRVDASTLRKGDARETPVDSAETNDGPGSKRQKLGQGEEVLQVGEQTGPLTCERQRRIDGAQTLGLARRRDMGGWAVGRGCARP